MATRPFRDELEAALARAERYARENAELRAKLARRPPPLRRGLWVLGFAAVAGAVAAIIVLLGARVRAPFAIEARAFALAPAWSVEPPIEPRQDPIVVSQGVATVPMDDDLPVIHPEGTPVHFVKSTRASDVRGDPLRNAASEKRRQLARGLGPEGVKRLRALCRDLGDDACVATCDAVLSKRR